MPPPPIVQGRRDSGVRLEVADAAATTERSAA